MTHIALVTERGNFCFGFYKHFAPHGAKGVIVGDRLAERTAPGNRNL
jgi:hypothetical protein